MTMGTTRCRACKTPIWFGVTEKGRRQPLDIQPVDDGTIVVDRSEGAVDGVRVRTLRAGESVAADVARYKAHFATCRKRKGRGQ